MVVFKYLSCKYHAYVSGEKFYFCNQLEFNYNNLEELTYI